MEKLISMKMTARVLAVVAVGCTLFSLTGCDKLRARDQLNKGVAAYKNAKYEEAIDHFQRSVAFDPGLLNAKLYLATAYAQQFVPGVDTPDNNKNAEQAINAYQAVLQQDPSNINSVKGIAYIYLNMKKFDQAKEYYERASKIDPNDPEPYYSVGVIDWTQAFKNAKETKGAEGIQVDDDISKNAKICGQLKDQNSALVTDGLDALNKALKLRPDYDDAMAYVNLMYRRKGDLECGDPDARAADLKTADEWVEKTMETKKKNAQKHHASQNGEDQSN